MTARTIRALVDASAALQVAHAAAVDDPYLRSNIFELGQLVMRLVSEAAKTKTVEVAQ